MGLPGGGRWRFVFLGHHRRIGARRPSRRIFERERPRVENGLYTALPHHHAVFVVLTCPLKRDQVQC